MGWPEVFSHPLIKHQEVGQSIKKVKIDDYTKNIFLRLQKMVKQRNINSLAILDKYQTEKVDFFVFRQMLREVDPSITSHEVKLLFEHIDTEQQGWICWH